MTRPSTHCRWRSPTSSRTGRAHWRSRSGTAPTAVGSGTTRAQAAPIREESEEPARVRVDLGQRTTGYTYSESSGQSDERASLSPARIRALDSIRGRISTDLNSLRGKVDTRDKLFGAYHGSQVQLKPQRALSSRNETLDQLNQRAQNASNVSELSNIAREVSQIKAKIDDDISLINRMSRAG